ncbi:metallophosphoesterase [Akkermansia sp.]|uniref:metallophosphoesterase n=1 Tax=Akkermansia sp. TaxID=1872421 RepID=UPI003AF12339
MTAAPAPSKKRSLLRKFLYLAAAAVLLGSLLLSYMQWEANTLKFRETQAPAGCLPGLSGLRILVLSDVHTSLPLLEEAVQMAGKAKPDMIVFLGDLYTDYQRATHAGDYIRQFQKLSSIAPSYACLGNHDMALSGNVERILKEGGFTLLRNSASFITVPRLGNAEFKLAGLGDVREGDCFPDKCMTPAEPGGGFPHADHRPVPQPQGKGTAGPLPLGPDAFRPYARRTDQASLFFLSPADDGRGNHGFRVLSLREEIRFCHSRYRVCGAGTFQLPAGGQPDHHSLSPFSVRP